MYSQFYWNDFAINPAYTGLTGSPRIQLGYRNQWSGFNGAPSTFTLGGHTLLKKQNIGLGGMLFLDDTGGAMRQTGAMLNYSYILKLNSNSKLSMALSGIINQYSYDGSEIENIDPDPALSMNVSQLAPDMSFGLVYSLKDKLLIGLGINQLIQSKLGKFDEFNNLYTGNNRLIRHYHLSAMYTMAINDNIQLDPYLLLRSTFISAPQFELGVKSTFNQLFFVGANYRHQESVIALLGVNYKNAILAYSYDYPLSDIRSYSNGSHEILLAYQFNKPKEEPAPVVEEDPDRDGDGILDKDDLCPDTPGLRKNTKDALIQMVMESLMRLMIAQKPLDLKKTTDVLIRIRMEMDLLDNADDCPSIAGPVENKGCPYKDTDGDGLLDKDDECPMTPGPKENNGCPIIEKEEQEVLNTAFSNLEFETNLDVIKSGSKPALIELGQYP